MRHWHLCPLCGLESKSTACECLHHYPMTVVGNVVVAYSEWVSYGNQCWNVLVEVEK